MRPRFAVALSILTAAAAVLAAGPAAALCDLGGVERASPTAVWLYFVGPPIHVKLTHENVSQVYFIKPPPLRGPQLVARPAIRAELGDRLYSNDLQCFMRIVTRNGQIGVEARAWPMVVGAYRRWTDWGPHDQFIPAR